MADRGKWVTFIFVVGEQRGEHLSLLVVGVELEQVRAHLAAAQARRLPVARLRREEVAAAAHAGEVGRARLWRGQSTLHSCCDKQKPNKNHANRHSTCSEGLAW